VERGEGFGSEGLEGSNQPKKKKNVACWAQGGMVHTRSEVNRNRLKFLKNREDRKKGILEDNTEPYP